MTEPIDVSASRFVAPGSSVAPSGGSFREVLEPTLLRAVHRMAEGERAMEQVISSARRGVVHRPEELLALQATVYRYTQELELASKLVDKGTTSVQRTLQSSA